MTVVVTGASGGVGRAAARAFAARGDRVAMLARGHAGLAAAADDVVRAGGEALTVPVDVQQTAEERDPGAPVNLWSPADGPEGHDFGAHGRFGEQAHSRSAQSWASRHHTAVGPRQWPPRPPWRSRAASATPDRVGRRATYQ